MATIIDALAIQVGFDTSQLTKGHNDARSALKKTAEEATKSGAQIEAVGKTTGEALEGLARKALALFAIFAGASSVKAFVADIAAADSALGRFAASMNVAPQTLSAFANAVERGGGNADAAAASWRSLSDSFIELQTTGKAANLTMLQMLQGKGGAAIEMYKGPQAGLVGIINNMKALADRGEGATAHWFGRQLGLDEGSVNLMMQGLDKYRVEMEKSQKLGVVTPESAAAAQKLLEVWISLKQAATDLGRRILTDLAPYIQDVLEKMEKWIEKNKAWLIDEVSVKIKQFSEYLRSIDWKAVGDGFGQLVQLAKDTADAFERIAKSAFFQWMISSNPEAFGGLGTKFGKYTGTLPADEKDARSLYERVAPKWAGGKAAIPRSLKDAGSRGWWTADRQAHAIDRLMKEGGLSEHGAAGLVARWAAVEAPGGPTSRNPKSGAWGIGQWLGSRKVGIDGNTDFDAQLDHTIRDLNHPDQKYALGALKGAKSAAEGSRGASMYERAEGFAERRDGTDNFTAATPTERVHRQRFGKPTKISPTGESGDPKSLGRQSSLFGTGFQMADISALSSPNALQSGAVTNDNSTRSNEMHVGHITVNTQATDAHQIARDIKPAMERHSFAQNANYSLA